MADKTHVEILKAGVAGWNRWRAANPELVLGEHYYMTEAYMDRHQYDLVPRNDLRVPEAKIGDYEAGTLEDWVKGDYKTVRPDGPRRKFP